MRIKWLSFLAASALLCLAMAASGAFATTLAPVRAATVKAVIGKAGKTSKPKTCYKTGEFQGKIVRVPVACPKPLPVKKCFLTSNYKGKTYKKRVDCPVKKPGKTGGTGSTGASGGTGTGSSKTVDWSTAAAAVCDDGSVASSDGFGYFSCDDESSPFCDDTTAVLVVDVNSQAAVCLPSKDIPVTGVCDDGSIPGGANGTDSNGTPLCADGDDAYIPSDYASGIDICDDGSTPVESGKGGSSSPLCSDGTYPQA